MSTAFSHQPVLLAEVLANLAVRENGTYVDATFGRGGHSREILKRLGRNGRLLVIDKDLAAIESAKAIHDQRIQIRHGSFAELRSFVEQLGWSGQIDGILFDLGVSSPQLDEATRGFSFLHDGPLDMRMNETQSLTAARWLNTARESEIAAVLKEYGEERFSKRIARAIVSERQSEPFATTGRLAAVVSRANPCWEKHKHPATRVFQAVRIYINDELDDLRICLAQSLAVLAVHGRLLVISFHSLEDRIVKDFIKKESGAGGGGFPIRLPIAAVNIKKQVRPIGKAIRASDAEVAHNPRARSATLRVVEKIA